jgi:hypothetical protein
MPKYRAACVRVNHCTPSPYAPDSFERGATGRKDAPSAGRNPQGRSCPMDRRKIRLNAGKLNHAPSSAHNFWSFQACP